MTTYGTLATAEIKAGNASVSDTPNVTSGEANNESPKQTLRAIFQELLDTARAARDGNPYLGTLRQNFQAALDKARANRAEFGQNEYEFGYEVGLETGKLDSESFDAGFDAGYDAGYADGGKAGYHEGYGTGYNFANEGEDKELGQEQKLAGGLI